MRILALSDIHNAFEAAEEILSGEKNYDIVLICGDITTFGSPADAKKAIASYQGFGRKLLAVSGNMDSEGINEALIEMKCSIDGKGKIIDGIGFFGVSAAPVSTLHTPYERSENEILKKAIAGWEEIRNTERKVFVPHSPPYDTKLDLIYSGKNVGSRSIKTFIEKYQPDAVVCGHIHEAYGVDTLGKSQIINCGSAADGYYAIIEIDRTIRLENKKWPI